MLSTTRYKSAHCDILAENHLQAVTSLAILSDRPWRASRASIPPFYNLGTQQALSQFFRTQEGVVAGGGEESKQVRDLNELGKVR